MDASQRCTLSFLGISFSAILIQSHPSVFILTSLLCLWCFSLENHCFKVCFGMHSFGVIWIWIRISDSISLRSWCIKGTNESTLVTDSLLPLTNYDLCDLGSLILRQITPKDHTLDVKASFMISILALKWTLD